MLKPTNEQFAAIDTAASDAPLELKGPAGPIKTSFIFLA
ncbi:hypothetical protein R75465_07575 [Paraburkholderia aspalathi]|nr:hypothetical protein R75465_07575 [Paraburkholderia aspalathi]